jgi:hypothetical protein
MTPTVPGADGPDLSGLRNHDQCMRQVEAESGHQHIRVVRCESELRDEVPADLRKHRLAPVEVKRPSFAA